MVIPMRARDRNIGALTLISAWSGERYAANDLRFGQILAGRIGLALDNAGLFSDLESIERRMDTVMSILDEAIVIHGADGELVFANPAAARMLGFESAEEAVAAPDERDQTSGSRSATRMGATVATGRARGPSRAARRGAGAADPAGDRPRHRARALDANEGPVDQGRRRRGPVLGDRDRGRHRGQARRVLAQAAGPDRGAALAFERLPRDARAGPAPAGAGLRRLVLDRDPARGGWRRARGDRTPRSRAPASGPRAPEAVSRPVRRGGRDRGAGERRAASLRDDRRAPARAGDQRANTSPACAGSSSGR